MLAGLPSALFNEAVVMLAITLKEEDRNNACLCSNLPKSTQSSGLDANWQAPRSQRYWWAYNTCRGQLFEESFLQRDLGWHSGHQRRKGILQLHWWRWGVKGQADSGQADSDHYFQGVSKGKIRAKYAQVGREGG